MATALTTIRDRIRVAINEKTASYFTDADLMRWYDEGCVAQHEIVMRNAEALESMLPWQRKKFNVTFRREGHPYFMQFVAQDPGTLVAGTMDYALPADFKHHINLTVASVDGDAEQHEAQWREPGMDSRTRRFPQWAPSGHEHAWTILASADGAAQARVYGKGSGSKPASALAYTLNYYRTVVIGAGIIGNSDVQDPYNDGPIQWVEAMASQKQNIDPQPFFATHARHANAIVPIPNLGGS